MADEDGVEHAQPRETSSTVRDDLLTWENIVDLYRHLTGPGVYPVDWRPARRSA